ncbi:MAG: guanylate kinase, partial [Deltaproteobacteria bacterium]|nr:guanylate kinase [Deltaproteobacteria bacterium]
LMRHFPDSVSIFLLPPSFKEIENRLLRRGTDSHETIRLRVKNAHKELVHAREYSYLILNDDVDRAAADVKSVIRAHQLKRERQARLLDELLEGK